MSWLHRFRNLARTERHTRDIEREMAFHIAERAESLRAAGMSEEDAWLAAKRRFGNRTYQGEQTREAGVIGWLDSLSAFEKNCHGSSAAKM